MRLVRFSYKGRYNWELQDIFLGNENLIVGKNSTGKSRLLIVLNAFKRMVSQTGPVFYGKSEFEFLNNDQQRIIYTVNRADKSDIFEELKVNGNTLLSRDAYGAWVKPITSGDRVTVHPPSDKLILHIRRDKYDHPHFEQLIKWAENIHYFKFGHVHAGNFLTEGVSSSELENVKSIVEVYRLLNSENRDILLEELNKIGFSINSVLSKEKEDTEIYVREADIDIEIRQSQLSQGLFRSISLLIFLNFLAQDENVSMLLIDDLCEGLDYERSSKLSKLIFEKVSKSKYQLIATTNDYFLMESIPIVHWNVLRRKGGTVTSISHHQNPEVFKNFKFTGLSNFDFFSSDYLDKNT